MNVEYMKRSKEELDLANSILRILNDNNVSSFINHLIKSMAFITDFLNSRHVDFDTELPVIKSFLDEKLGSDFLETYFYLNNLSKKDFKVFDNSNIVISGKVNENVSKDFFKQLSDKIVRFFNTTYDLTMEGNGPY